MSPKGATYYNNGCQPIARNKSTSSALKGRYSVVFRPFRAGEGLIFPTWGLHPKLVQFTPSGLANNIKFAEKLEPIPPALEGVGGRKKVILVNSYLTDYQTIIFL